MIILIALVFLAFCAFWYWAGREDAKLKAAERSFEYFCSLSQDDRDLLREISKRNGYKP